MKKNVSYLFISFAVMAAVVLFIRSGNAAQKNSPVPTKVAVVDIVKVFNDYQRTKEINERLNKEQVELQNQRKQKIDRVEALKAQLDSLHPDSKDYYQREKELLELSIELKNFTDIKAEEVKREFRVMTEDIYGEMIKTIESVAKDAGYDLVLYLDLMDIHGDSFPALLEKIRERKVLYSTKEIDITQNVLDNLNQTYKLKGPSSSESPKNEDTSRKSVKPRKK
jgi:Skp family chaperone for outer membrane proteins